MGLDKLGAAHHLQLSAKDKQEDKERTSAMMYVVRATAIARTFCQCSAALYAAAKRATRSRRCATRFMTGARETARRTGYFSDTLKCSLTQGCVSTESRYLKHRQPAAPLAEPGNTGKKNRTNLKFKLCMQL